MNTIQIKQKKSGYFSSLYPLGICGSILSLNYDSSFSNKEYTISLGSEVVYSGIFEATTSENTVAFPLQNTGTTYTITSDGVTKQISTSEYYNKVNFILRHFSATIKATYPAGSNITCSNGTTTIQGNTSGYYEFTVPERGTWIITCTDGSQTASGQVPITTEGQIEEIALAYIKPVFNDNSWEVIHNVSLSGAASSWWSVGDRKAVTLNGTCQSKTFSNNTYYCYILGIDHNTSIEGANKIHLQFGATSLTGGTYIAFVDGQYLNQTSGSYFTMNTSNTNSGGYNNSRMKSTVCPSFKNVLPSDLQAVIQPVTKYQNNGKSTSGQSGTYEIWLLSEMEIFGSAQYSNYTSNQQRYKFYAGATAGSGSKNSWAAASTIKYKDNSTSEACFWWERSALSNNSDSFCIVITNGSANLSSADYGIGFAPCLCV